jgi:hypothetical protein
MDDAAYQAPKPPKAKTAAKMIRIILRVLLIAHSFYIELIKMVSPRLKYGCLAVLPCHKEDKPHIANIKTTRNLQ